MKDKTKEKKLRYLVSKEDYEKLKDWYQWVLIVAIFSLGPLIIGEFMIDPFVSKLIKGIGIIILAIAGFGFYYALGYETKAKIVFKMENEKNE